MIFLNKYIKLILPVAALLLLPACIYEKFDITEQEIPSFSKEGNGLSLMVELPVMDTRAGEEWEKYEDYIDMSKLRLLFFKAQGPDASDLSVDPANSEITKIRAYKGDNLIFTPIDLSTETYHKKWHVNIPLDLEDEEDVAFIDAIRNNDFKIAVLANWNMSDDEVEAIKTINDLHHIKNDNTYSSDSDAYGFLVKDGKMGVNTNWVNANNDEFADANKTIEWIRENWNPSEKTNYRDYEDLWMLWNFQGALTDNPTFYLANKFAIEWAARNKADLQKWLKTPAEEESEEPEIDGVAVDDDSESIILKDLDPLTTDNAAFSFKGGSARTAKMQDGKFGIILPAEPGINLKEKKKDTDIITFKAVASGQLRIKWGSSDSKNAQIEIDRRTIENSISRTDYETQSCSSDAEEFTWDISITGDSEYISIYGITGNPIIYEIEYIQGKYLYDTDRVGIQPDPELNQTIPMYGVQKFGALKDVWKDGTVFDLSNFDGQAKASSSYEYSDIYLLRSVAKVELLIPNSFEPHHVYLRSMNSSSRNEPMDVVTNTRDIWADDNLNSGTNNHISKCEWTTLNTKMKTNVISPFFNIGNDIKDYKSALAWYYGRWDHVPKSENFSKDTDYPHLLNPMINRSDFTEFLPAGTEGNYNRYVLYVPEKFVDDPNEPGNPQENPKVCHIEFRAIGDPHTNLDDDNCYRLYFTEGGFTEAVKNVNLSKDDGEENYNTWERKYEQNVDNLRKHWPIMRNHVYKFTVLPGNNQYLSADVKVLSWKKLDVPIYW